MNNEDLSYKGSNSVMIVNAKVRDLIRILETFPHDTPIGCHAMGPNIDVRIHQNQIILVGG